MSDCCKQTSSFYTSDRLTRIEERLAALERGPRVMETDARFRDEPTDAELLAALRAELGEGWTVKGPLSGDRSIFFQAWALCDGECLKSAEMGTLRRRGAPVVAGWLRGLAGVDA